jgi:leucyl aminopeptidase (aminopeptidase T)
VPDAVYSVRTAERMARMVLRKILNVRAGESVTIETWSSTLPWASAFLLEARRIGAYPVLLYEDEPMYWRGVDQGLTTALAGVSRAEWGLLEKTDAYVFFWGPSDTFRELSLPDSFRSQLRARDEKWFAMAHRSGLRMARIFLGRATPAAAERFGVSFGAWQRELLASTFVDPLGMDRLAHRLAGPIRKGKELTIRHRNGTDLRLRLKQRDPFIYSGNLKKRPTAADSGSLRSKQMMETPVPSGYVVVALDEEYAEGTFVSNLSTETLRGVTWKGSWTFRDGRLSEYSYSAGGRAFSTDYAEAGRGRDRPGYLSIGLNPKIKISPWMKDQGLGYATLNIGGNRWYGGTSDCDFSAGLLLTGSEIRIDDRTVVKAGRVL